MSKERRAYSVNEFCQQYAISRTTFYEEVKEGKLIVRKVRGSTRVFAEDIENWRVKLPFGVEGATEGALETRAAKYAEGTPPEIVNRHARKMMESVLQNLNLHNSDT